MKKIITYCDPLLEPSHRDGSNGGHNICFHSEIRTNVSIILKEPHFIWSSEGSYARLNEYKRKFTSWRMRNGYQRQYHEKKHRLHYSKALNKPAARKFMFTDKFVFIHKTITASKGTAHILFCR